MTTLYAPSVEALVASLRVPVHADDAEEASGKPHFTRSQALHQLRTQASASTAERDRILAALWSELRQERDGPAVAWMLLAELSEQGGHRLDALRAWHQASRRVSGSLDADALRALGLDATERWSARVATMSQLRAEYLQDAYSDIRRAYEPRALFRIDRALTGYLGKASVFSSHPTQRPKLMFIPGLRSGGFIEPASHPLVAPLLAGYAEMLCEFEEALSTERDIEPFLGAAHAPGNDGYVSGPAGSSWDALFFFRHGRRYDSNHLRFPRTSALLDSLDLCRIDGQAPEICFSILRPHTRIEPHHGVTNARVVIHIPFRVPPGCHLELLGVGRHYWREGEPLVFDDTFEHAAENPADAPRGILLMDAWHPELTPPERAAFRAIIEAITRMEALPEH